MGGQDKGTSARGCGVGGGSLVYASTHLVPPDEVFEDPAWRTLGDWKADLQSHYATAARMLGVTTARCQTETDHLFRQIAREMGREATYHSTEVAIHFGEPGQTASDPYFDGAGPERTGCTLCGGCMVGCRHDAKNTLDKNYLYFAQRLGAEVIAETQVQAIRELPGNGYRWRHAPQRGGLRGESDPGAVAELCCPQVCWGPCDCCCIASSVGSCRGSPTSADGSAIPVNLGVNPSHTILALSEWFMSHAPNGPHANRRVSRAGPRADEKGTNQSASYSRADPKEP